MTQFFQNRVLKGKVREHQVENKGQSGGEGNEMPSRQESSGEGQSIEGVGRPEAWLPPCGGGLILAQQKQT